MRSRRCLWWRACLLTAALLCCVAAHAAATYADAGAAARHTAGWRSKQRAGSRPRQQHHQQQQQQQSAPSKAALAQLLAATARPSLAALDSLQAHNHSLPLHLLRNGVVFEGSGVQLRRLLRKLQHREPVHIALVGGSISWGLGLPRHQHQQPLSHRTNSSSTSSSSSSTWFEHFTAWLRAAFPDTTITARSGAVLGARSEYLSACLNSHVDPAVDLVFVEVAADDGFLPTALPNELVAAHERLLRQLLRLPARPAVVLLHALHGSSSSSPGGGTHQQQQQQPNKKKKPPPPPWQFHVAGGPEDHYGVLAQFYGLPTLSLRDAVWHGMRAGRMGLTAQELFVPVAVAARHDGASSAAAQQPPGAASPEQQQLLLLPSAQAHRHLADLAIHLLQETFLRMLLGPLPSPGDEAAAARLPAPLLAGNWEGHGAGCASGLALRGAASTAAGGAADTGSDDQAGITRDWYFAPERPSGAAAAAAGARHHWGWVSHVPNATLVLRLDTLSKGAAHLVAPLSLQQRVTLLQRHGFFAGATSLLADSAGAAYYALTGAAAAAPLAGPAATSSSSGGGSDATVNIQPGLTVEELQAAALLQSLRHAPLNQQQQQQRQAGGERLVGAAHGSGLHLPPSARLQVGKMVTGTGVEVLPAGDPAAPGSSSSGHRRLQQQLHTHHDRVLLGAAANASSSPAALPAGAAAAAIGAGAVMLLGGDAAVLPPPVMVLWVGFLQAHRRMARARIYCISGCSCAEVIVDGQLPSAGGGVPHHGPARLASVSLTVTQSPRCRVGVQLLAPSTDGSSSSGPHLPARGRGSRFKVTGVMLAQAVHYEGPGADHAHEYFLHPPVYEA